MSVCVVLAAALLMLVHAWERLQGQLSYLRLQELKSGWHETTRVPHDRELNEGFKLGYRAVEHERGSPEYRYMLASMHAWRERGLRLWPQQAAAENRKIIENLKAALSRRPSWFEAWILLALVKYQSGEVDHELQIALEKSIETGPYETVVHHGISYIGPRVWVRLGPDLRAKVVDTVRTALDNPDINRFATEQIVLAGWEDLFRDELESDPRLARLRDRFLKRRNEAL